MSYFPNFMKSNIASLFARPKIGDIKADRELVVASMNLIDSILNLNDYQYALLKTTLLPTPFSNSKNVEIGSQKFLKHGADVKIARQESLIQAFKKPVTPLAARKSAFDALDQMHETRIAGYSLKPVFTTDRSIRHISLVNTLEGTLLYWACANDYVPKMNVEAYADAKKIGIEGLSATVRNVPSRTAIAQGKSTDTKQMHTVDLTHIPLLNTPYKFILGSALKSDHVCEAKRYGGLRYTPMHINEQSSRVIFCPHDIAAYLAVASHFMKKGNRVPAAFSPFVLPAELLMSFYRKLDTQVLIQSQKDERSGIKNRVLTDGEKEILLWGLIRVKKYEATCTIKKPIADYKLL